VCDKCNAELLTQSTYMDETLSSVCSSAGLSLGRLKMQDRQNDRPNRRAGNCNM